MTTMAEAGGKVLKLPGEWDRVPVRGSRRVVPATAGWDVLSQIRYAAAVYSPVGALSGESGDRLRLLGIVLRWSSWSSWSL
jgi:hypothetical protein